MFATPLIIVASIAVGMNHVRPEYRRGYPASLPL
jgi:hypothetical protein